MISLDEALEEKLSQEDLKSIIESNNPEKKFILSVQLIFATNLPDLGWNILKTLDLQSLIDENFVAELHLKSTVLSSFKVIKFLLFIRNSTSSESLKMAIQKHLNVYSPQKQQDSAGMTISDIIEIIDYIENQQQHDLVTSRLIGFYHLLIKGMSGIQLPREPNEMRLMRHEVKRISDFFSKLPLSNEERFRFLEFIYSSITNTTSEPMPLISIGFLVIPDEMIAQAVENFFRALQWSGKKTSESIVIAMGRLIYWLRTTTPFVPVPLELWVTKTIAVLHSKGYNEIIDDVAKKNILQAFLTLVLPVFQTKTLPVVQSLLENSQNTKEVFDLIAQRACNVLKRLEDTKSEIFESLMDLMCETLGVLDQTDTIYKELINFLEARDRFPSKVINKKLIGPSYYGYLSNNARVGLGNLGNTCYLNSILQALFMTKQFCRDILLTQRTCRAVIALQKLFALMLFSPRPEQNPTVVVNFIRPDDFMPGIQHDSSEFLGSLLDRLHELEKKRLKEDEDWDAEPPTTTPSATTAENVQQTLSTSSTHEVPMDVSIDENNEKNEDTPPKNKVIDNTVNLCQTYIQKTFGGKICTRYLCSTCKSNSINVDSFRDLQLSFPEKSQDENSDMQYTVQQLLEFYFSTEELTLDGDNQYHCDNCKILCNGIRCTEILEAPRNLILTLKHFRYDSRYHTRSKLLYKVFHDEVVTLNVKGSFKAGSMRNVEYKLYAAVVHAGTSLDSGHYYTIARESENQWYQFNDSYVTKSSLDELRSLISPNTPYILFYQRLSTASATVVHSESATSSTALNSACQTNDQFPEYHDLPTFLKDLIDEDKTKYEDDTIGAKNKINYGKRIVTSIRDNFDDNNDGGSGTSYENMDFPHNRFIY